MEIKIDVEKKVLIPKLRKKYGKLSSKELLSGVKALHCGNEEKFSRIKNCYEDILGRVGVSYIKILRKL